MLMFGMTEEQFWYSDYRLIKTYIKKYELERNDMNYKAWLNGLYIYKAVGVLLNGIFSKSGQKDTYFEKPLEELNYNFKSLSEEEITDKHRDSYNDWAKLKGRSV